MHPILVEIFGFPIPTYGVVLALTFLVCLKVFVRLTRWTGLPSEEAVDLWIWVIVGAVIGGKLLLVIVEFDTYWNDPAQLWRSLRTLGVFYGGLIGGVAAGWIYARRHDMPVWTVADTAAPVIALGQGLGRWGCLFAGCCYGAPADPDLPWAIRYTNPDVVTGVPLWSESFPDANWLHPAPIYASLNALLMAAVLLWLLRRRSFQGQVFWTYVLLYGATRPLLELFRGDDRGELLVPFLTPSQLIGIVLVLVALVALVVMSRRGQDGVAGTAGAAPRRRARA